MEAILAFIIGMFGSLTSPQVENALFTDGNESYYVIDGQLVDASTYNPSTSGDTASYTEEAAATPAHTPAAATGGSERGPRRDNGRNTRPSRNGG